MVDRGSCRLVRRCSLPGVLDQASSAFWAVLEKSSLTDIVREGGARLAAASKAVARCTAAY